MKLASPEALRWEPPLDPPDRTCTHERTSWRFGRFRCRDCGEAWSPREDEEGLEAPSD